MLKCRLDRLTKYTIARTHEYVNARMTFFFLASVGPIQGSNSTHHTLSLSCTLTSCSLALVFVLALVLVPVLVLALLHVCSCSPITAQWRGGSLFAAAPQYESHCVTKAEYEEHGHRICAERFDFS